MSKMILKWAAKLLGIDYNSLMMMVELFKKLVEIFGSQTKARAYCAKLNKRVANVSQGEARRVLETIA